MGETLVTKGTPYGQEDKLTDLGFGVAAYTLASGEDASPQLYLHPTKVDYDATRGEWQPAEEIFWPDRGGSMRFLAYAPFDAAQMTAPEAELPFLAYTTPEQVQDQHGLLVATPAAVPDFPSEEFSGTVKLGFRHVLSGISFAIGEGMSIQSITVSGVYDSGVYHYDTGSWVDLASTRSYTIEQPELRTVDGYDVVQSRYVMMFPPQTCPEGALIHIEAEGRSLDIPIAGDEWPEGYVIPYILGRNDYTYHFGMDDPVALDWKGGASDDLELESWREDADGNVQPVSWIVEGYYASQEDAEAKSGKLTDCFVQAELVSEPDGDGKSSLRFVYSAAQPRSSESSLADAINAELSSAPVVGSSTSYWNLANPVDGSDNILESANTYVVSAPGWYRIPLVMGAGVKDGAEVNGAFSATNFRDYKDAAVESAYLHRSSTGAGVPSAAYVLWEDRTLVDVASETSWKVAPMEGGSSAISYYGGCYWLHVHIAEENIGQGLAHLSVTDGDDLVMWSYLLWVTTPEGAPATGTLSQRNLGWIEKGLARENIYDAATAYVRLEQQKIGGKVLIVKVDRPSHVETVQEHKSYSPYYQFGRKDPLTPGEESGDVALMGSTGPLPRMTASARWGSPSGSPGCTSPSATRRVRAWTGART